MNDCMIFKVHLLLDGERVSHAGGISARAHTNFQLEVEKSEERKWTSIRVLAFYQPLNVEAEKNEVMYNYSENSYIIASFHISL